MTADGRRALREVLVLYISGLAVLFVSDLGAGIGGIIGRNAGVLSSAFFLLAPVLLLRHKNEDPEKLGIHGGGLGRALIASLAVGAVVFPLYALGYEAWSRWRFDRPLAMPERPWSQFEDDVTGRPDRLTGPGVRAWVEEESLHVLNAGDVPVRIRIDGCGCPVDALFSSGERIGVRHGPGSCSPGVREADLGKARGLRCSVADTDRVSVAIRTPGIPLLTGASGVEADPGGATFDRTFLWIPFLFLVNLAAVALPEEVFYRGYVQGRLAPIFSRRFRVLGADIGGHVFAASALFALSHLVTLPAPFRLAVFFPGLLFGWLRERTGSVVAPALLHAASNVLLEVLVRYHGQAGGS